MKTLSDIGIDIDFITDLEDEITASQQDYGLQNSLNNNVSMLKKLESEQKERLLFEKYIEYCVFRMNNYIHMFFSDYLNPYRLIFQ